ncbi:MAG: hypothetical protein P4L73_10875 [Caulobacteraceae bacterium]|nr:hypothetical protein [Caulobacteraceae bacterium]
MRTLRIRAAIAAASLLVLAPSAALACACGCGVFDVGGVPLMANGQGGEAFVEYDYMNQTHNHAGTSGAPAADNADKQIRSNFVLAGVQYMINHDWGVMAELPVTNRLFRTADSGAVDRFRDTAIGDVRLMGVYTGLSPDMSTGLIFGVKLPTGDWKAAGFDRDTAIGSGSTDLILGGYHVGQLGRGAGPWGYFIQGQVDTPLAIQDNYRPGTEFDGAAGVSYDAGTVLGGRVKVAPVLQLIGSARAKDGGAEADPPNSGYERVLISPGVELDSGDWKLYGDVEFPVYQRVNGDQLVAPQLFKLVVSRRF